MPEPITSSGKPLHPTLHSFLTASATPAEQVAAVQAALEGPQGKFWRRELGQWTIRMVPVELLVPAIQRSWRPLVRQAMLFVVSELSPPRLAPKIVEQLQLPPETPPEARLLSLIAKVPGLQKIGQVLARNRSLDPRVRRALIKLENGISDVTVQEIRAAIENSLPSQMETYSARLDSAILSEASVSAVVGFTWRNPATRRRERGVFKVLKPFVPSCYAEDMEILGRLARYLARKRKAAGKNLTHLAETLTEIRLLLQREVDFPREQDTLAHRLGLYRSLPGVRVPRLISELSTPTITALGFERGKKVTEVRALSSKLRANLAERLAKTLLAAPALSRETGAIFHADPHAGNLLYDQRRDELVILDWALTDSLTLQQRRNVLLLALMTFLRDADGMSAAIANLCDLSRAKDHAQLRIVCRSIEHLLNELPLAGLPGLMHALRLLDEIALQGVPFPAALLMFRKAAFTLEGVVDDIAGSTVSLNSLVAAHSLANWKATVTGLASLFSARDWLALDWSALTLPSRVCSRALFRPWYWLPGASAAAADAA